MKLNWLFAGLVVISAWCGESSHGKTPPAIAWSTELELVSYYNSDTGARSEAMVEVDRNSEGHAERINWPNTGWIEVDGEYDDRGDGTCKHFRGVDEQYTFRSRDGAMEDRGIIREYGGCGD